MEDSKLQWHPAFQAAIQIELEEEQDSLQFSVEHTLSKKPLQIDVVIIKMEKGKILKKKLGKLFRQYNIVEYKSPGDYVSVNDFYKVLAYACLYQSDTASVLEIPPNELTITLVCSHFPRELIRHLKEQYSTEIEQPYPGIYHFQKTLFPMQILVIPELSREENVWLSRLRTNLTVKEDIEPLTHAYEGKENIPNYAAVMDLIVRANKDSYKEEKEMSNALRELFADEFAEKEAKGKATGKIDLICRKIRRGNTAEEIADILEEKVDFIRLVCAAAEKYAPEYDVEQIYQELSAAGKI